MKQTHLRVVGPFKTLRGPQVALLWSWTIVWVLRDPLGAPCRPIHGAHRGGTPGRSRPRAHTSRSHARGAAGAGVGHILVIVGWTSHLSYKQDQMVVYSDVITVILSDNMKMFRRRSSFS